MSEFKSGDIKIAFRQYGQGQILILLHGFGGSVLHWEEAAKILSVKYRVVVPNLSHLFMGKNLTFTEQVDLLIQFIETCFPHEQVSMAGLSYGAAMVWGAAIKRPDLINKTIFINPMQPNPSEAFAVPMIKYFFKFPLKVQVIYQMLRLPFGKNLLHHLAEVFRTERAEGNNARIENLHGRKLKFVSQIIYNFSWMLRSEDWGYWKLQLASLSQQSLLIYDSKDPLFHREGYVRFADLIKCKEILELRGCGHIAIHKDTRHIVGAVESFMQNKMMYQAQGF